MMETFTCDHCGAEFPIGAQTIFDEQTLCETCLEELFTQPRARRV